MNHSESRNENPGHEMTVAFSNLFMALVHMFQATPNDDVISETPRLGSATRSHGNKAKRRASLACSVTCQHNSSTLQLNFVKAMMNIDDVLRVCAESQISTNI